MRDLNRGAAWVAAWVVLVSLVWATGCEDTKTVYVYVDAATEDAAGDGATDGSDPEPDAAPECTPERPLVEWDEPCAADEDCDDGFCVDCRCVECRDDRDCKLCVELCAGGGGCYEPDEPENYSYPPECGGGEGEGEGER